MEPNPDWSLSWDLEDPDAVPYFNWDAPVTNRQVRAFLASNDAEERLFWIARIMREARYLDVWRYLSLRDDVLPNWNRLSARKLGRRQALWSYLIRGWKADGLV